MRRTDHSSMVWLLKRYLYIALIVFLAVFFVVDFTGMLRISSIKEAMEHMDAESLANPSILASWTQALSGTFWYRFRALNAETIFSCFGIIGFGSALLLFRHHFSRKDSMRIAALPIPRGKDFLQRCFCFILLTLLPILICFVIYPVMVYGNGFGYCFDQKLYLMKVLSSVLTVTYGFSIGLLAASVCGTLPMTILVGFLLAGAGELLYYFAYINAGCYLLTLSEKTCWEWLKSVSPFLGLYKFFYDPGVGNVVPGIIAILVFSTLAFFTCHFRKAENAGISLSIDKLDLPLWILISILGGAASGYIFLLILGQEIPLYLAVVLGCFAAAIAGRILLDLHARNVFQRLWIPGTCAVLLVSSLLCMRYDIIGFDSYAPDPSELTSVTTEMGAWRYAGNMTFTEDEQAKESCAAWIKLLRDERLQTRKKMRFSPYWNENVTVTYVRNGKKAVRVYNRPENQADAVPLLKKMIESAEYRESREAPDLQSLSANAMIPFFGKYGRDFSDEYKFNPTLNEGKLFTSEQTSRIREALTLDMQEREYEDYLVPQILELYFYGINLDNIEENVSIPVYANDERTLEEILGTEKQKWIDYAYGSYMNDDDLTAMEVIRDPETKKPISWKILTRDEFDNLNKQKVYNQDPLLGSPYDENHMIAVYSKTNVRNYLEWADEPMMDIENPETWPPTGVGYNAMYLRPEAEGVLQ